MKKNNLLTFYLTSRNKAKKRRVDHVGGRLDQRAHKAQKNGAPKLEFGGPATSQLEAVVVGH